MYIAMRKISNDTPCSVAEGMAVSQKIHRVFASDGPMSFIPGINVNCTDNDHLIYLLEKDKNNKLQKYPMGQATFLLFWEDKQ